MSVATASPQGRQIDYKYEPTRADGMPCYGIGGPMEKTPAFIVLRALGLETTTIDLVSPLRRDECVRRLREHVDAGFGISGMRPVIGQIRETSFTLRQRVGYRNSFKTVLRGTFVDELRGTRLHCRSGVHPFVRVFILLWLAVVAVAACALGFPVVSSLIHGTPSRAAPPIAVVVGPALMFCFGVALAKVGRRMARGEQQYLVEFLAKRLDAREAPVAGG